jgi:hypothetical protein
MYKEDTESTELRFWFFLAAIATHATFAMQMAWVRGYEVSCFR